MKSPLRDLADLIQRTAMEHPAYGQASAAVLNLVDHLSAMARCEEANRQIVGAEMAKIRLEDFADQANAGRVHHDARELKRRIWAAFAQFDEK